MLGCDQSIKTQLDNKPKTRKQTQNTETKNRGVSVEHRGVCVCGMFGCDQFMKTQNSTTNTKLGNKPKTRKQKSWGERRAAWCMCGMFGCDQSMKTQNSTTILPGLH